MRRNASRWQASPLRRRFALLLRSSWHRARLFLRRVPQRLWPTEALGGHPEPSYDLQSLTELVRRAGRRKIVHPQAAEIASRALSFGMLRVHEVMVPRNRIKALPLRASTDDLRRILLEEGHARMPVHDGTLDNIVGVLVARDVLALAWEKQLLVLDDLLQPPYFAPEMMYAADLLKELQRRRMHFAIVVDELGGTAGIVTLEDLLEELVGDIFGEHDLLAPELVHHEADGTLTLEGMMPVREANRDLSLGLPESDAFTTIGGLCVSVAGRIPEAGQQLELADGVMLEVVEASPRTVTRVRLQRLPQRAAQANAAAVGGSGAH